MARILLAEDDLLLAQTVCTALEAFEYAIEHVSSGDDALQILESQSFDLLILDWNMPGSSGIEVCKQFRKAGKKEPVLMLTSRSGIDDKEEGLYSGADDYLTKPFEVRELLARIKSLLRRPANYADKLLKLGEITVDLDSRILKRDEQLQRLQPRELALLEFFMRRPGQLLSAEAIFTGVWGSDFEGSEIALRSCLAKLRKALASLGYADLIETVHGAGYKLRLPDGNKKA
ncbi:MAG: response regulator transcription factor [Candidatus Obscuribacterales bacterium]|nr:response regulator transcription factor [Candidatus Obscuribacterales bacterium]